ncbi:MAG: DUF983 domain-containing protein [Actinomycetota bacterium]|nr:DUF983 domain-containing protein [Actinomycetota bacterium]
MARGTEYRTRNLTSLLVRGFRKRCPMCGGKGIFASWSELKEHCPTCGYTFVREDGYWVGAMIVNFAAAEIWFFALFVGVIIATLPDIPWQPLLAIALVTNGVLPIVFYPRSKTVWMALDLFFHPRGTDD